MSKYKTCPFCAGNLTDYSQPCPMCGKIKKPETNIQQTTTCPHCGASNPHNYNFCSNCSLSPSGNIPHGHIPPDQGSYIPPMGTLPPEGTLPAPQANAPENSPAEGSTPSEPTSAVQNIT